MRILLVEDEERMSEALQAILRDEKYDVDAFLNGLDGCDAAKSGIYDLMILDVMLPGMNGFDIAKNVRGAGVKAPILMLTAKADLDDKVMGLELGSDDYVAKPYSVRELMLRVKNLLNRTYGMSNKKNSNKEEFNGYEIDYDKRIVLLS